MIKTLGAHAFTKCVRGRCFDLEFRHAQNRSHFVFLPWIKIDRRVQDVARLDTKKLLPFTVTQIS